MSLEPDREVHSRIVRELPIGNDVIDKVNKLGSQQKQMNIRNRGLCFEWHPGRHVNDVNLLSAASNNDLDNAGRNDDDIILDPNPALTIDDIPHSGTDASQKLRMMT